MKGTLYGIGLGPGDSELMTLKAVRLISAAKVIAYPSLMGGDSFARSIAAPFFSGDVQEISIVIPMTTEREPAQKAYDKSAAEIATFLATGQDVIVLCEGDPFFYGSFMYLYARLSENFRVEVVPGVTSMTACASAVGLPLAARNEVLTVIPGPLETDLMMKHIKSADSLVIMKVGRHMARIRNLVNKMGLLKNAVYIERATLKNEQRMPLVDAPEMAPYFSMILLVKGGDPWL
jgi:precorrin-2/cobalt-factor-2 C20-methyltransferase